MSLPSELVDLFLILSAVSAGAALIGARRTKPVEEPREGQPGKDAVWVPTPPNLVEAMLDVAGVTSRDYLIDLGSGDGRIVRAAAKRGARGLGIEYDSGLVALSERKAREEGVEAHARFVQGDIYQADISEATVVTVFLLPDVLRELAPRLSALKPGTRVVANRFGVEGWRPTEVRRLGGNSERHCTALLYVLPAAPAGP
jgi:SAM-dependent methyltransferase